jgi:hypothetical protein
MNIVQIVSGKGVNGAIRHCLDLTCELAERGHEGAARAQTGRVDRHRAFSRGRRALRDELRAQDSGIPAGRREVSRTPDRRRSLAHQQRPLFQRAARARVPVPESGDLSHAVLPASLVVERSRDRADARHGAVSTLAQRRSGSTHRRDSLLHRSGSTESDEVSRRGSRRAGRRSGGFPHHVRGKVSRRKNQVLLVQGAAAVAGARTARGRGIGGRHRRALSARPRRGTARHRTRRAREAAWAAPGHRRPAGRQRLLLPAEQPRGDADRLPRGDGGGRSDRRHRHPGCPRVAAGRRACADRSEERFCSVGRRARKSRRGCGVASPHRRCGDAEDRQRIQP